MKLAVRNNLRSGSRPRSALCAAHGIIETAGGELRGRSFAALAETSFSA